MSGRLMQYTLGLGVFDKLPIISHRKSVICFESTVSLLRKLTKDFLSFFFIVSSRTH